MPGQVSAGHLSLWLNPPCDRQIGDIGKLLETGSWVYRVANQAEIVIGFFGDQICDPSWLQVHWGSNRLS